MKRLQLQRFDMPSADLDHATLTTQLKWPFNIGAAHRRFIYIQNVIFGNDQVASLRRLPALKSGCNYIAISTLYKAIFWHHRLMLNTLSPHIIVLPEPTLSYKVEQNVIYLLVNVIYIYIIIACCGEVASFLNTTFWKNSILLWQYADNINTIYNDVDVIFLHYSY